MVHLTNGPDPELQELRAAILVLSIALACATQPGGQAMMRQAWRLMRPPVSEEELARLASTWELTPTAGKPT